MSCNPYTLRHNLISMNTHEPEPEPEPSSFIAGPGKTVEFEIQNPDGAIDDVSIDLPDETMVRPGEPMAANLTHKVGDEETTEPIIVTRGDKFNKYGKIVLLTAGGGVAAAGIIHKIKIIWRHRDS